MALTEKQELFCQRYLIDFNGSKAAIEAGYAESGSRTEAWRLLTNADIQARIKQLREEMGKAFNVTRERIAQEYARIAFFDIRKIHTVDGAIKPVTDFDDDEAAAIAGIEVYEEQLKSDSEEDQITIGRTKKIKVTDKRGALDSLCKLMGYNEAEKHVFDIPTAIRIIRDKEA